MRKLVLKISNGYPTKIIYNEIIPTFCVVKIVEEEVRQWFTDGVRNYTE